MTEEPREPQVGRTETMLIGVVTAFVVSRLIFYLTALFAVTFIPESATANGASDLVGVSWQWDGEWFFGIITDGYSWNPEAHSNVAFFPLFPMLVRVAAAVLPGSVLTAGVMLNHVVFFAALVAVWFYAEGRAGARVAGRTVLLLSIFPTAFFFSAAYSEPVFLLACAAALTFMHRGNFVLAGIAGMFASAARPAGLLLAIPYLVLVWRSRDGEWSRRDWLTKLAPVALVGIGIGLYAVYLGVQFGEPLAFSKAQQAWGREMTFPLLALGRAAVALAASQPHELPFFMNIVNVTASIGALWVAVRMWRTDPAGAAFVILALLAYLTYPVGPGSAAWDPWQGNSIQSMGRYVATLFPIFVPMARWGAKPERFGALCAAFVVVHVVLGALFMRGHYVF